MQVSIERSGAQRALRFSGTVAGLLDKLGLSTEEVLVTRDGAVLTEADRVSAKDRIRILSVISGG